MPNMQLLKSEENEFLDDPVDEEKASPIPEHNPAGANESPESEQELINKCPTCKSPSRLVMMSRAYGGNPVYQCTKCETRWAKE